MAVRRRGSGSGGGGGGSGNGGGGGGDVTVTLSGNEVETLFDNRPSTETALTTPAGQASWAGALAIDLGRELTADDDDKDLRVRFSYTQSTAGRMFDVQICVSDFREWTEFATATGTTGVPVGNIKFPISRGISSSNNLNNIWNRQGMMFRRDDSADGNHRIGIIWPAGDNNSGYVASSAIRGVVELIPRISSLEVSAEGGGGGGAGLETFLGLPDPSEDYENQVVVNRIDRREYICLNEPVVSANATGTLEDLSSYYTTDDANLRVFHDLPASASSTDDDTWIYIDSGQHRDKFYFGDTAPGSGNYAWYEDSPADALREVCRAYVENVASTSITNLGAGAPVVYLGQFQDDTDIRIALHSITPDFTTSYYVAWNIQEQTFKLVEDDYAAPGTVQDHWRWENVRAEALNPILRPHLSGQFPTPTATMFEENAVLVDFNGNNWHIKRVGHGAQSARGTWDDYDAGDTLPGFNPNDDWRGVVSRVSDVTSANQYDTVVVVNGLHAQLEQYVDSPGLNGWFNYVIFGVTLLGAFRNQEDADSAVGSWASGDNLYAVWGGQIHRLTAFTAGTASTHRYSWVPASSSAADHPIFYFWGRRQSVRWPDSFEDDSGLATRKLEWQTRLGTQGVHREEYNAPTGAGRPVFVTSANISSDIDSLSPSNNENMVFMLPAGRWNLRLWWAEDGSVQDRAGLTLRRIASGTDDIEVVAAAPQAPTVAKGRSLSSISRT